jgi:AraC-like DNA-binding protein
MEPTGRIVVMRPDAVATAAVINGETASHDKTGTEIITGHDVFLFVARGEGSYHANGRTSVLRPNTLISAPAGTFACSLGEDREMYVVAVRDPVVAPEDPSAFSPFLERHFSPSEGSRWRQRMMEYADRAASGRFGFDDVRRLKNAVLPFVWKREPHAAQATLQELFGSIWTRLAQPLTLESLARDVGYTANYLNDLTREHTGRALGSWIADMRMARARAALELTDLPVADVGVSCGYDDPAYFSRAFRRAHGVPPATWRVGTRPHDSRYAGVTIPIEVLHEIETSRMLPQRAYSFAS